MGEDDDMEKKAVSLGRGENGIGIRPDRRHVRSLLPELGLEKLSKYPRHSGGRRSATKHRAAVAPSVPGPGSIGFGGSPNIWQFRERVMTHA